MWPDWSRFPVLRAASLFQTFISAFPAAAFNLPRDGKRPGTAILKKVNG